MERETEDGEPGAGDRQRWTYPPELLSALLPLGLAPSNHTPPVLARQAVDELYKYELRRLRDRLQKGEVVRSDYLAHVIALRKKYWTLTLPLVAWEKICASPSLPSSP